VFTIVFLASRDGDSPQSIQISTAHSLDLAIKSARFEVENFAHSGAPAGTGPIGFVVENTEGDELHRWYSEARR
jgi:hypothetical protein